MQLPYEIRELAQLDTASENELVEVLENSLRASHGFFSDRDAEIRAKTTRARADLHRLVLVCAYVNGKIRGFSGISGEELKMLYVHPEWQGGGMGRSLIRYSLQNYPVRYVDVYERNEQAVGFYRRMGFACRGKTVRLDGKGRPLPVLRMELTPRD
jgi:putative acetyltransferase